jgi:hypothetical protein
MTEPDGAQPSVDSFHEDSSKDALEVVYREEPREEAESIGHMA